jgi:regulator of RNase E activity RraA
VSTDENELVKRLRLLDSCAVSDALDSLGLPSAVTGIAAQSVQQRIAGRVVTVMLVDAKQEGAPVRHLCTAAIEVAGVGDVLVIEQRTGIDAAAWGGVLSNAAQMRGIEGVVVDGPARDIDEAAELGFPVYARNATARTARGRIYELDFNIEIKVGDVATQPGDLVMADRSAVVLIPGDRAEEVLQTAEMIVAKEKLMTEAVRRGDPVSQVMGADYEKMLEENTDHA